MTYEIPNEYADLYRRFVTLLFWFSLVALLTLLFFDRVYRFTESVPLVLTLFVIGAAALVATLWELPERGSA